jgi:hypothetical protein
MECMHNINLEWREMGLIENFGLRWKSGTKVYGAMQLKFVIRNNWFVSKLKYKWIDHIWITINLLF